MEEDHSVERGPKMRRWYRLTLYSPDLSSENARKGRHSSMAAPHQLMLRNFVQTPKCRVEQVLAFMLEYR